MKQKTEHRQIKCPECGAEFEVETVLRETIEKELRQKLTLEIRNRLTTDLKQETVLDKLTIFLSVAIMNSQSFLLCYDKS